MPKKSVDEQCSVYHGGRRRIADRVHPARASGARRNTARRRFAGKIVLSPEQLRESAVPPLLPLRPKAPRSHSADVAKHSDKRWKRRSAAWARRGYIRADVRIENDVKSFVDQVAARYGRIDIAFNNAGITLEKPLHEYTSAEWDDIVHTNLRGAFLAMKYEIPAHACSRRRKHRSDVLFQRDRDDRSPLCVRCE